MNRTAINHNEAERQAAFYEPHCATCKRPESKHPDTEECSEFQEITI